METSPQPGLPAQSSESVPDVVEHLFRHEAGKIVATLTRIFGIEHWALAEDVVQEALARALQRWPYHGVPKNPSAWITTTAKNLALDAVRRQTLMRNKEAEIVGLIERDLPSAPAHPPVSAEEIKDDRLRMMFVCCHPILPQEAQVALALNTLCGFSAAEIAHAFLTTEAAIAKRLTRAKQKIREARIEFEIPEGLQLEPRLQGVMQIIYLLFNEGYKASSGPALVREDLCREAIRLGALLAEHPAGNRPAVHALVALMLLNAARLRTRTDSAGNILRLREQDRSQWDQPMIARGMVHLLKSAAGDEVTEYHLQAGIAACHCAARDFASTDWRQILSLYDRLVELDDSPVVALNRAVAVAQVHGPEAGIQAVETIRARTELASYHLLYAVLGELEAERNRWDAAAAHFRRALQLTEVESEQAFLRSRLDCCLRQASLP